MYPSSLEKLITYFRTLPSVGQKTAERYALSILQSSPQDIESFAQALIDVKNNIKKCQICGNLSEQDVCPICHDNNRDKSIICVVQQPKDIIAIERVGIYNGYYHVLGGAISPIKGILPQDLNFEGLFKRINENIKEIIIATDSTIEGETTALYITKVLKNYPNIIVTRLASGLPMGGNLDYADEMTLSRAIQGRIKQ